MTFIPWLVTVVANGLGEIKYASVMCFVFSQIMFDNRAHSGKIQVDVEYDVRIYECREWSVEGTCKSVTQTFTLAVTTELLIQPSHPSLRVANALHMHYKCKI